METPSQPEKTVRAESAVAAGDRRSWLAKSGAMVLGAVAYAAPVVGGLAAFLNPLRQKGSGGRFLQVASLETLPDDGTPQKFPVVTERVDAWTRSVEPVGAVYLRRTGENQIEALQAVCPHAGCTVDYKDAVAEGAGDEVQGFVCPCHKATFDLAGKRLEKVSQSPRDLDALDVEIRNGTEVWVQFQSFKLGTPDKAPLS
jgi:menaquinol-cytochrome c reductase iron-sulfur subunit